MYTICKIMWWSGIALIFGWSIIGGFNEYQKKHDPQNANYSKIFKKTVVSALLAGICSVLVSSIILLLKMY